MEKYASSNQNQAENQQMLMENPVSLQKLIDNLPVLLALFDSENRLLFANAPFTEWFCEHSALQVHGKTLLEILGERTLKTLQPRLESVLNGRRQSFEVITG